MILMLAKRGVGSSLIGRADPVSHDITVPTFKLHTRCVRTRGALHERVVPARA